jgi:hypothetical protein
MHYGAHDFQCIVFELFERLCFYLDAKLFIILVYNET